MLTSIAVVVSPRNAVAQTVRASRLDGGSHARFVHTRGDDAWGSGEQITASAWIRATTAGGTVVYVNGSNDAWFLRVTTDGFLQFGRGTATVTSTLPVAMNRWVHVAASAYPNIVIFSVDDGFQVRTMGDAPVTDDGPSAVAKQLWIGARPLDDLSSAFDYLHGDVDLVRVWNRLVVGDELRVARYDESASPPAPMGAAAPVFNSPDGYRDTSRGTLGRLDGCLDNCVPAATAQVEVIDGVLLQALTIPRIGAASAPVVDGRADRFEYDGGEELAVASRGDGAFDDTRLRAVHDDDNAYYFVDELLLDPSDPEPSVAELFFQAERTTSGGLPTPGDLRISVVSNGLADPTIYVQEADGFGGYIHIADGTVEVAAMLGGFELSPTLSIEVRVSADRLGPLVDIDGLALRFDGPTRTQPLDAPEFLVEEDTLTWMPVRYEGVVAPPTRVQGTVRVVDGRTVGGPGYPNADYFLRDGATFIARLTTDAGGNAGVDVTLTGQLTIQLATDVCTTCRPAQVAAVTNVLDWARVTNRSADGFACPAGTTCNFGEVTFFYRTPIPASTFNPVPAITPTTPLRTAEHAQGALALQGSGDAVITGTNLHGELVFYAARADCFSSIPTSCPGTEVLSTTPCADGTENCVNVRADLVAESCGRSGCELWVNDPWARPGTLPWQNLGALTFVQPTFVQLYSTGFQNASGPKDYGVELSLYLAGMSGSYINVFGCEVPDPLAALEGSIVVPLVNTIDGTCAGIAAATNMFARGSLLVRRFEPGAIYPAGLTDRTTTPGRVVPGDRDGLIPLAQPRVDVGLCTRPVPANLFAHLRMLHQRQGTARFLDAFFDQVRPRSVPVVGYGSSPNSIWGHVRSGQSAPDYIMCMNQGTKGHCVVPTGTSLLGPRGVPSIQVIDNDVTYWGLVGQWQNATARTGLLLDEVVDFEGQRVINQRIDIDSLERDVYQRIDDNGVRPDYLDSTGLYLIPTSVFEGLGVPILSLEGLADGISALGSLIAFGGDAEAIGSDGSVLGWSPDGTSFTTATEHGIAWAPASAGDEEGDLGGRDFFAVSRRTDQFARVVMRRREAQYRLAVGSTGPTIVWWLANDAGLEGADNVASTFTPTAALSGTTFTAAARGRVRATVGVHPSSQSGVTLDVSAVVLDAGEALEIRPIAGGVGVELRLNGATPLAPMITLRAVDAASGLVTQRVFGPVILRPGARVAVRFDDWPSVDNAIYAVDLGGGRRDDLVGALPTTACGDPYSVRGADSDEDGIEDACEAIVADSVARLCGRHRGHLRSARLFEDLCDVLFDVNASGTTDLDDVQAVLTCFAADSSRGSHGARGALARCIATARLTAGGRGHACDVTGVYGCDSLPIQARVCHQRRQCCLPRWGWTQVCVDLAEENACER